MWVDEFTCTKCRERRGDGGSDHNSQHIPIEEIEYRVEELEAEEEIVVCGHVGQRSAAVAEYLTRLGFKNVKNLLRGLDHWAQVADPTMPRY